MEPWLSTWLPTSNTNGWKGPKIHSYFKNQALTSKSAAQGTTYRRRRSIGAHLSILLNHQITCQCRFLGQYLSHTCKKENKPNKPRSKPGFSFATRCTTIYSFKTFYFHYVKKYIRGWIDKMSSNIKSWIMQSFIGDDTILSRCL